MQVIIADTAGPDLIILAIEESTPTPWCVVFPYRYEEAARRYSQQYPDIPTILLSGGAGADPQDEPDTDPYPGDGSRFFEYFTDTKLDYYRAGQFSAILSANAPFDENKPVNIPVFLRKNTQFDGTDIFLQGFNRINSEFTPEFFDFFAQLALTEEYPLVVLAGSGGDYLDKNPRVPFILFTWLNPSLTSREAVIIMDDSVWAQINTALTMVQEDRKKGEIPSKPLFFSARIADNRILRQLKNAARTGIEQEEPDGHDFN